MPGPRESVVAALTTAELAPVVDFVAWVEPVEGVPVVHVANFAGAALLYPGGRHELLRGVDPIATEDPMAFLPYQREIDAASPRTSRENAYPYAAERLLGLFGDPERSPDVVVVHTPAHYFPQEGGHLGEHGSLDVIQSRAPLVMSGPGVAAAGIVDDHALLVDVGPTMAYLAGVPARDLVDAAGEGVDGRVLTNHLHGSLPRWVVGILWDGAPCGDLLAMAEAGELPAVQRLVQRGTALRGGAIAQFPSVTLANHASILTGLVPRRHGILGNVFFDRATGERVVANDATTWHRSAEWLRPDARTVFDMVNQAMGKPNSFVPRTACVDEAVDASADWSTMQLIRNADDERGAEGLWAELPDAEESEFVTDRRWLSDDYYRWGVRVDDFGLAQMRQLYLEGDLAPRFTWWANVVTDAGHHGGGPRSDMARASLREADARLGAFLDMLEEEEMLDDTAIVLTADHGFEAADPAVTGSWRGALDSLGIGYRDEGPGFIYLQE